MFAAVELLPWMGRTVCPRIREWDMLKLLLEDLSNMHTCMHPAIEYSYGPEGGNLALLIVYSGIPLGCGESCPMLAVTFLCQD